MLRLVFFVYPFCLFQKIHIKTIKRYIAISICNVHFLRIAFLCYVLQPYCIFAYQFCLNTTLSFPRKWESIRFLSFPRKWESIRFLSFPHKWESIRFLSFPRKWDSILFKHLAQITVFSSGRCHSRESGNP
jgi:hypothetical protein